MISLTMTIKNDISTLHLSWGDMITPPLITSSKCSLCNSLWWNAVDFKSAEGNADSLVRTSDKRVAAFGALGVDTRIVG